MNRKKTIYDWIKNGQGWLLGILCCTALLACHEQIEPPTPLSPTEQEEPASLTMDLAVELPHVSRTGGAGNSWPDPNNKWEMAIDGRFIYDFFFLLMEKTTDPSKPEGYNLRMVGYRQFTWDGTNTQYDQQNGIDATGTKVRIKFDYDHPQHGNIEKLHRGNYAFLLVCNYGPKDFSTAEMGNGQNYAGLTVEGNTYREYTDVVSHIIQDFDDRNTEITNDTYNQATSTHFVDQLLLSNEQARFLFLYKQKVGDDGFCPLTPMPLSTVSSSALSTGVNHRNHSLLRTRARVTVEIRNNSSQEALSVEGLKLTNFSQAETYLTESLHITDFCYKDYLTQTPFAHKATQVADTTSNAIRKFEALTGDNALRGHTTATANKPSEKVVFDGYVLQSKSDAGYTFQPQLAFRGVTDYVRQYQPKTSTLNTVAQVTTAYNADANQCYLIENGNTGQARRLLRGSTDYVYNYGHNITDPILALERSDYMDCVWQLERKEDNKYYLRHVYSGLYLDAPNGTQSAKVPMVIAKSGYYEFIDYSSNQAPQRWIAFKGYKANGTIPSPHYYLDNYHNSTVDVSSWTTETAPGGGGSWRLVPLEKVGGAVYDKINSLVGIDPETANTSLVTKIDRNDHFYILISATYETGSGNIYFEVKDWNTVENELMFD